MKRHTVRSRRTVTRCGAALVLAASISHGHAAPPVGGVDLDITKFRATSKVDLSSRNPQPIDINLTVKNRGTLDEPRTAVLVGRSIPGNSRLFGHRYEVYDDPRGGPTTFTILPEDQGFVPQPGGIRWTVFIDDDNPDNDTATDITVINP
jgi:hypothetical protein